MQPRVTSIATTLLLLASGVSARAQQGANGADAIPRPRRSADGRLEITAQRTTAPLVFDGVLDDPIWATAIPVGDFVQAEPDEGKLASDQTDVWIVYDATNLYVAAYCHQDPGTLVITDVRKDFQKENQDDFEVILDTFGDRRNGYVFATTPAGGRADEQVTNEGRDVNTSWDAPWSVRTHRVDDGWTLEMAIPLGALRSREGAGLWGINFSRRIRRRNEVTFWSPVPRAYTLARLSLAGNLVGLGTTRQGRELRVTPYVAGQTVRETGGPSFDQKTSAGLDLKYGLTTGLTLDVTANPDFAQSEADEQQVNLTQFSQFFPEKRDFFLENAGLFYIGDTPRNRRTAGTPTVDEDLLLFFSRRMGLSDDGRPIGIDGGARLTGQEGGFQLGALGLQTRSLDSLPRNDFGVVRLRRNLGGASDLGGLFMMRSNVEDRGDYNRVYGVDANIRLPQRIDWSSYVVNSETPGVTGPRYAYFSSLNREANFWHVKGGVLSIGENFNDELGFLRRTGVMKWSLDTGIRPRFAGLRRMGIREIHPHIVYAYYTDPGLDHIATRFHNGLTFFFNNGGFSELSVNPRAEQLTTRFELDPGIDSLSIGNYSWNEYQLRFTSDESRALSVNLSGIIGGLWNGTQKTINASVSAKASYRFRATVGVQRTSADVNAGSFVRALWTGRVNYSFTTNMFVDALAQYDAEQKLVNLNVRFNLIHHPLSNLYLVWNEQRFTDDNAPVPGRSLTVKFTQMVSF